MDLDIKKMDRLEAPMPISDECLIGAIICASVGASIGLLIST